MTAQRISTTKLSTKGQLILPKAIRDRRNWAAGMQLTVEDTADGVLIKAAPIFPPTRLEDVAGCLTYDGPPATPEDMDQAIEREVRHRHARGRH